MKNTPSFDEVFVSNNPLAVTYFPTPSQVQYRQRYNVSLPCSGWERVGPLRSYHQEKHIKPPLFRDRDRVSLCLSSPGQGS